MARELIPSLPPFSSLEFPVSSCSSFVKSDVKPSCIPQVIDLTSENSSTRMSQQPLRHMPPYPPHPPSAFHRVNHPPGHLPDSHGNAPSHGCPFLHHSQARQQQHHRSHNRLYHPPTNNAFCPLSMGSTVPLQHHPPHLGPPVLIDVDQVPDHIRAVPVTSLPNSLLVAAPTYVQPHQPPVDVDPRGNDPSTHHHHHYHHHHHHHHHFVQPPYQVPQPQAYQPYPSPGAMHYRHYRRWHQNSPSIPGWPSRRTHGPTPPPHPPLHTGVHPYPDLLYHLISAMSMQPIATQPPPPTWEEETYPQENYETLLNLAEQMGEVKPKGLSRVEIDQLPTYRVTAGSKTDDDKRCVVCLVDFEEKQLVRILPCLHEYHTRCIDKWLKSNRTCPICRAEVNVNSE